MNLVPRQFPDDTVCIGWAISFMKTERASLFADRTLHYRTKYGALPYADWAAFQTEFISMFCPRNKGQNALTRLETEEFYQGRRSVDEYTDKFHDLIELAGYTDGLVIVMKYQHSLAPEIQNQVATMTTGRPVDDKPTEWYDMVVLCNENRRTNAAFVATKPHHTSRNATTPLHATSYPFRMAPQPPTSAHVHVNTPSAPPPTLPPGVPMDINAARHKHDAATTCYRCSKLGHMRKDCPRRHDVHFMTLEERSNLAEQTFMELDINATAIAPEGEDEAEQAEEQQEDFASCSG